MQEATQTDVAKLTNISSYIFNNCHRTVAPATSEHVHELNHYPNSTARALRTGYSKMLGVIIVPRLAQSFQRRQLRRTANNSYWTWVFGPLRECTSDPDLENRAIRQLLECNVDAIFLSSLRDYAQSSMAHLEESRFVFMDQPYMVANAKSISTDSFNVGPAATRHLIDSGKSPQAIFAGSKPGLNLIRYPAEMKTNQDWGRIVRLKEIDPSRLFPLRRSS